MTVNFKELLSKPVEEAKAPPPLSIGHYDARIVNFDFGESKNKKTPYVRFAIRLEAPRDDVEKGEMDGIDLGKRQLRKDYFLTEDALYRLRDFIETCGIKFEGGRSFDSVIPELVNQLVIAEVTRRPNEDGSSFYNDISDLVGVPA